MSYETRNGRQYKLQELPWSDCGICGRRFQYGGNWHNAFFCSHRCCAQRRANLAPPEEEDDTYYG